MKRIPSSSDEPIALFSFNLKMVMHQRALTQKDLAALSGLTETQVSRYLRGKTEPGISTLHKQAKALNVSPAIFLCPATNRFLLTSLCWTNEELCEREKEGTEIKNIEEKHTTSTL